MSDTIRRTDHWAFYGSTLMPRVRCIRCGQTSLVIGEKTVCCSVAVDVSGITMRKRMTGTDAPRRKPSHRQRAIILEEQGNACFYCRILFGEQVRRGKRSLVLRTEYDHFVPYAYAQSNQNINFVAACHVCNRLKTDRMFSTAEEAKIYLALKRQERGYNF